MASYDVALTRRAEMIMKYDVFSRGVVMEDMRRGCFGAYNLLHSKEKTKRPVNLFRFQRKGYHFLFGARGRIMRTHFSRHDYILPFYMLQKMKKEAIA